MKTYFGTRTHQGATVWVTDAQGRTLDLSPRFDLRNHSPTGFEWGYGGSGPAQLALALLVDATGQEELALSLYQRFKANMVVTWGRSWKLTQRQIQAWVMEAVNGSVETEEMGADPVW